MRRTVRLNENDLSRIVRRVIREEEEIIPHKDYSKLKNAHADLGNVFLQAGISTPSGCKAPETISDVGDCYIGVAKLISNGEIESEINENQVSPGAEFLSNVGMFCGEIIAMVSEKPFTDDMIPKEWQGY